VSRGRHALDGRLLTLTLDNGLGTLELNADAAFSQLKWMDHDEEHAADVEILFQRTTEKPARKKRAKQSPAGEKAAKKKPATKKAGNKKAVKQKSAQ
jgi:hypothetical protein